MKELRWHVMQVFWRNFLCSYPACVLLCSYDIPPPIAALSSNPYNEDSDRSVRDASTMVSTEFAQYAKDMGFDDDEIQRAALK